MMEQGKDKKKDYHLKDVTRNLDGSVLIKPHSVRWDILGKQIKRYRIKLRLRQKDLAELVGTTTNTISRLEIGAIGCSIETLLLIADALQVSPDVLLTGNFNPAHSQYFNYFNNIKEVLHQELSESIERIFQKMEKGVRKTSLYRYETRKDVAELQRGAMEDPAIHRRVRKKVADPNLEEEGHTGESDTGSL